METNNRRSGDDRRQQNNSIKTNKRDTVDRRTMVKDSEYIIQILKKLPLFKKLRDYHYKKILNICSHKVLQKDQIVCKEADKSNEMYILLSGQLKVIYRGKTVIASISPISLVGELAIFTGEQGFSSVITSEESSVITLHKDELFDLLINDRLMSYNIFMNVISELAKKLRKNNEIIEELRKKK